MAEGLPARKFASPEEEIAYLRQQIAEKERSLLERNPGADNADLETLAKQEVQTYGQFAPENILEKKYVIEPHDLASKSEEVAVSTDKIGIILKVAHEKGIRNTLSVLEKTGDAYLTDEVHRTLVQEIKAGRTTADLKEGTPLWNVLHMTLFEVALPDEKKEGEEETSLKELISTMEQFYAGMQSIDAGVKSRSHYTIEIAVSDKSDDIIFYIAVPTRVIDLFEKQILSLFPHAIITEQQNDYNIFVDGGVSKIATANLKKHPIYPIRHYETFDHDPLDVLLNTFSKIERDGGGAALQIVIRPGAPSHMSSYEGIVKRIRDGEKTKIAIRKATFGGEMLETVKEVATASKKKPEDFPKQDLVDQEVLELFQEKMRSPIAETNIRIATSAASGQRAEQILYDVASGFNQFEHTQGNRINFNILKGKAEKREFSAFSFREFSKREMMPLSLAELTTIVHVPPKSVESSPQFKQSRTKRAPAPLELPRTGTLIGANVHRNVRTDIYITPEDRLRHFYIIGQTGTGKTTLMKNMIREDIENGDGVCMIDPHGTDIADVLAAVPDARRDDVIYFDPSYMDEVIGLNMLEYDPTYPQQKTFVVNELFSIFQKLYGKIPESMGPIFEQYFRNATMLVLEDPESGSTLLDVSRVMSDAAYREEKLTKARNPVVVQFWKEIATKAGGEAALENIVPYITSKFDVFTANDYIRPIIGQQKSSFDFRKIMDEKKILLVNLSKGRLGEINANLIGMIIVGKILMAALSRVDVHGEEIPPFYLHMDEFQSVTTDSITAILSEARKYKLGLTMAHQYIAQLDERISDAVFGNVGSIAAFRVGPEDAAFLEKQFLPAFDAHDLMNIENHNAFVRILADGTPTKPFNLETIAFPPVDHSRIEMLMEHSYRRYGTPRRKVEMRIASRYH